MLISELNKNKKFSKYQILYESFVTIKFAYTFCLIKTFALNKFKQLFRPNWRIKMHVFAEAYRATRVLKTLYSSATVETLKERK